MHQSIRRREGYLLPQYLLSRAGLRRVLLSWPNHRVALINNDTRSATVTALEDGILFTLDKDTYNLNVREISTYKREQYREFVDDVSFLRTLYPYNKQTLCDVLVPETYEDGEVVVHEGDKGDRMLIVEDGYADAFKLLPNDEGEVVQKIIKEYGPKDYFGEMAIWLKAPRACTIVARGQLKLLSIDIGTFRKMLPDIEDDIRRNSEEMYQPLHVAQSPKNRSP